MMNIIVWMLTRVLLAIHTCTELYGFQLKKNIANYQACAEITKKVS